ncbi:MAG: isoleucine--tRNA ligase [Bacilli bacterium]
MEIKDTLVMPKGTFPMRGNLPQKEPIYVEKFNKIKLYQMLLKHNEGKDPFYLHDGPPYANNEIHAGHALNKIIKDIIVRSKNLEGFYVPYTPGWDTHGLPIELCVTKSGVDRRTTPPAQFRQKCREYALTQVEKQKGQMLRLGVLGDYDHPYLTLNRDYEVHQVEIFAKMAMDGLIYKGLKPVNWSPSSESALAEAEIEYKDVTAKTVYVKFKVRQGNSLINPGDFFVIWTTTPWTLPSNQGICLNPRMEYGIFDTDQGHFIVLKDLAQSLKEKFGFEKFELIRTFLGKDGEGCICDHPFLKQDSILMSDDYVTADSGTGCVHIASGHGLDDYRVAKKYNIEPYCPVDEKGYMMESTGKELAGLFYEEANDKVIEILQREGALLCEVDIEHSYPHDWRTKKPTIFRATKQWFCSISKIKEKLLSEAEKVKYIPEWGKVRFENMLSNRDDWCISRQRLWGVPIPIFYGEDGQPLLDDVLFKHVEELFSKYGSDIWYEKTANELIPEGYTNIHSPNGLFTKEKDIMDVWFDSGSSFLGSDIALDHPFPADVYFEGNDQYRGWYNSSMILSVAYTGKSPYKNILTHGFIVDQNGEKFSKSKKNGIDPVTICNNYGADILRLWTTSIDYTTAEIKLSPDLLKVCSEQYKKIRNTFKFMLTNLYDDDTAIFNPDYQPQEMSYVDKLMLNRLNEVVTTMKKCYDKYDFAGVSDALNYFIVNDLSSFYLDFRKDTLYCEDKDSSKRRNCQYVLFEICKALDIAYSPILCFTAEEIYSALPLKNHLESVALEAYPELGPVDEKMTKDYQALVALRGHVNLLIEPVRKAGVIGSSSEAQVEYVPENDEEKEIISAIGNADMANVLIVSGFSASETNSVTRHSGERCERCWNYFDETETVDEHKLCHRCASVYKKAVNK